MAALSMSIMCSLIHTFVITKMTLGCSQRHLLGKKHEKRYDFALQAAVMDDILHVETKAIWASYGTLRLAVSVHQHPTLPLLIPSPSHLHQTCQLCCEGSTCRTDGRGNLWPSGSSPWICPDSGWPLDSSQEMTVFSQREGRTKSILNTPLAAVFVLAATAPAQGMCSPGTSCLTEQSWSVTLVLHQAPKQATKRIHLVPNYCIQFCSVWKTWSGKPCARRPFA